MKILIVQNSKIWKSHYKKVKALQDWFKPVVKIDFDFISTNFKDIPFTRQAVDIKWYNKNILPLGQETAIIFTVPLKQWKGEKIRGWHFKAGVHNIQIGANEGGEYSYNKIRHTGGRWFNIARHEITHMLYTIQNMKDNTHYWWELGRLEETLNDLKNKSKAVDHMQIAVAELFTKEVAGKGNNPKILQWAKDCGIPYYEDETAWCSLFVNWVCLKANLTRTNKLNARSWLDIGKAVTSPKQGDLVVLWREHKDSWKGHVGFFVKEEGTKILILGGNQKDMVSMDYYPKSQLVGYRRIA